MMRRFITIVGVLILSLLLVAPSCAPAGEEAVKAEDFYKGKTITITSCAAAGTGVDAVARLPSSYLKEYTGAAAVIVKNKEKGAGLEGVNASYRAEPDGLTITVWANVGMWLRDIMNAPGVAFKADEFNYIIGAPEEPHAFAVTPGGPYKTVADLQAGKDLKIAGHAPISNLTLGVMTAIDCLGLDATVVTGLPGVGAMAKSVMSGETIGGVFLASAALIYRDQDLVEPLFVLDNKRWPHLPDVPAITELVKLTDEQEAMIRLWGKDLLATRATWTTPGVPMDRVKYLRKIYTKIYREPSFIEELNKFYLYKITPESYATGERLQERVDALIKDKAKIQAIFNDLLERYVAK